MNTREINLTNSMKIKITKYAFNIVKSQRGSYRTVASYNNFLSFLKDLPQNIIKNSDDVKSINDMQNLLNNYLEKTVPELLELYHKKV